MRLTDRTKQCASSAPGYRQITGRLYIHRSRRFFCTYTVPSEGETGDGTGSKLSELRAVIHYLLESYKQENASMKTQMEHLARDLMGHESYCLI